MSEKAIYIACGGSGGHIIPGLGVCNILSNLTNLNIFLVGVKREENKFFFDNYISKANSKNIHCIFLPDIRLKKFILFNNNRYNSCKSIIFAIYNFLLKFTPLNILVYMVKLIYVVFILGIKFISAPPVLIFGFGSYAAFPVVFIGIFLKSCFTVIHEQNVSFGKANVLLIPLVDKITLNFYQSIKKLNLIKQKNKFKVYNFICRLFVRKEKNKISVIGNPSLNKISIGEKDINLPNGGNINVLVIGGSQGSEFLNCIVPEALNKMEREILSKINIIHIAGKTKQSYVKMKYKNMKVKNEVLGFCFDMADVYRKTDFVISRAGAGLLSEIVFYKLPAILLPFRFVRSHKMDNAMLFKRLEAAIVLDEKKCSSNDLKKHIQTLIQNDFLREKLISNLDKFPHMDITLGIKKIIQQIDLN